MTEEIRPRTIGLPWYRAEAYAELRAVLADGGRLPARYDTWLMSAEQVAGEVERSGVAVVRVGIEPEPFAAWCRQRGLVLDAPARARYARETLSSDPAGSVDSPRA